MRINKNQSLVINNNKNRYNLLKTKPHGVLVTNGVSVSKYASKTITDIYRDSRIANVLSSKPNILSGHQVSNKKSLEKVSGDEISSNLE